MGAEAWFCSASSTQSLPAAPCVRLVFRTERPGKDHRPGIPPKEDLRRKPQECMALQCSAGLPTRRPGGVCVAGLSFSPATSGPSLGEGIPSCATAIFTVLECWLLRAGVARPSDELRSHWNLRRSGESVLKYWAGTQTRSAIQRHAPERNANVVLPTHS